MFLFEKFSYNFFLLHFQFLLNLSSNYNKNFRQAHSDPPPPRGPYPPWVTSPPLYRPLLMQTPDESRGYARGGSGGRRMGTPPPALSVHVASTWMHPSLSEMDALPPHLLPPPTTQWWGGMQGGWGVLAATQLLRSWWSKAATQLLRSWWSKAATQLLRSWWSKAATQLLRSWWLWGSPREPMEAPMGPRGARGGFLHPLTKSREGSGGRCSRRPPPPPLASPPPHSKKMGRGDGKGGMGGGKGGGDRKSCAAASPLASLNKASLLSASPPSSTDHR
nr:hypothetical protein [Morchella crassipes]